jgi:electron transport complex protein RnfG
MKKPEYLGDALKLFLITLIAGICLGAAYGITKAPIAAAEVASANKTYRQVFPDAGTFEENKDAAARMDSTAAEIAKTYKNAKIEEVMDAMDASGQKIGYVVNCAGKGYGGDVKISVGIKSDGTVTGIGFLSLSESPGLGLNAKKPAFYEQYKGKKVEAFSVVSHTATAKEGEINAISGATITSRAVTNAVNAALYFTKNCIGQ